MLSFFKYCCSCAEPQERLNALALDVAKDDEDIPDGLISDIRGLVGQGADLNEMVNGKTVTYLLCKKGDFNYVLSILKLGGDPRILNYDRTSLFSSQPKGRDIFMCVVWNYFVENRLDEFKQEKGRSFSNHSGIER